MKHLVAVYGTLRKGNGNHVLLQDAELVCIGTVSGMAMATLGGFPACDVSPDSSVVVEVYQVNDEQLARCDRLEGTDPDDLESDHNMYNRVLVKTAGGLEVWIYLMPGCLDRYPVIVSGDWMQREVA